MASGLTKHRLQDLIPLEVTFCYTKYIAITEEHTPEEESLCLS